jgi:hypothetical protein
MSIRQVGPLCRCGSTEPSPAPFGEPVSSLHARLWRVEGGKLAEHWDLVDIVGMEKQFAGK